MGRKEVEDLARPKRADLSQGAPRIIARCRALAKITDVPGQTTRLFLSRATRQAHTQLTEWMCSAGMEVKMDNAGNLRGLLRSPYPGAPTVLLFSHIDTVPNAGAFDGVLGVVLGIEVAERLRGRQLPFDIEIIALSEEEGVRFSYPFFGSKALVGQIGPTELGLTDSEGLTFADAVRAYGLDPEMIPEACLLSRNIVAALEMHIEQGPILESQNLPLAVVETIVGQSRLAFSFEGRSNHAGTTPMSNRRDALAAAAEWITSVEDYARNCESLVATVGQIVVEPNSINVIPGTVTARLDVRHSSDQVRNAAVADIRRLAELCGDARSVTVRNNLESEGRAVSMNRNLTALLSASAEKVGCSAPLLASGAGHDAMILAQHIPTSLLFVRSPGGLSHHPDEIVLESDVSFALITVAHFVDQLAARFNPLPADSVAVQSAD